MQRLSASDASYVSKHNVDNSLRFRMYTGPHREARSNPGGLPKRRTAMERVIAKFLQDFEQGKMNRRQLIQSVSVAAAAAAGAAGMVPEAKAAGKRLEDHYVTQLT